MKEVTAFSRPSFKCQDVDPYYIFEHIDEFDIRQIALDFTCYRPDFTVKFNDENHPVTYTTSFWAKNTLSISGVYYEKHQDLIDKLIIEICKKTKLSDIVIPNTILIDDKKLDAIRTNENIKNITLGSKEDIYTLDSNTYYKFKDSKVESISTSAVSPELENNFDPMIYYNQNKKLVGDDTYEDLSTTKTLHIRKPLSEEELHNLKYLNKEANIKIYFDTTHQFIEIINRFKELNQQRSIIININNKNNFNNYLFSHLNELENTQNIKVNMPYETNPVDLITYIKHEKELIEMIKPALDLSPFEKYLYAYNIAKQFKEYKENKEDPSSSRKLYQLLDNEYMVCVGFSRLLGDLLDKLGIENNDYSVTIETAYDDLNRNITVIPDKVTNEKTGKSHEILPSPGGHARREVHLIDEKYDINGYFIADPTWDNILDHDSYIHALMTHDEFVGTKRYNYMNRTNANELFFVHNIEEFYQKLNILLDKNPKKTIDNFIEDLLKRICKIDTKFYKLLVNKYQITDNKPLSLPFEKQQDILLEIGTHIISKTNNIVDGEKFKQGIAVIYSQFYDPTSVDIEALVNETIEYNKKRYDTSFPKRFRIDKDGNETIELNEFNKFDIETNPEEKKSL